MSNPSDILNKLQNKLFMKQMKTNVEEGNADEFEDVPYVDDEEYKTNVSIPPVQNEEDVEEPPSEEIEATNPKMDAEESELTITEIGKVYELKKIYSRLISVESYLSDSSDLILLKLRNYVSQSIELFELLIVNINSFKDQLDEIIIIYYEFIEMVYGLLDRYYKNQEKEGITKYN